MSDHAATALVARRIENSSEPYPANRLGKAIPPSQGKSPFSLDGYLSWMSLRCLDRSLSYLTGPKYLSSQLNGKPETWGRSPRCGGISRSFGGTRGPEGTDGKYPIALWAFYRSLQLSHDSPKFFVPHSLRRRRFLSWNHLEVTHIRGSQAPEL